MLPIQKIVLTIPNGAQGNLLITITCLIHRGIRNLITLVPRAFLFVDKGEHLILVLLCRANLECKKICASDWLKPISTLFYIPNLAFHLKKPIYSSNIGSVEEH